MREKAESLARRWMPGYREGGKRFAWEHPADLVRVIETEMPGYYSDRDHLIAVAWLHDIIEDGKKEDGSPVTLADLIREGIPATVVDDVVTLSKVPGGSLEEYFEDIAASSDRVKIAKLIDRLCNIREGSESFKDKRWIRYVGETCLYVHPLSTGLSQETRTWIGPELLRAIQRRPLVPDFKWIEPAPAA